MPCDITESYMEVLKWLNYCAAEVTHSEKHPAAGKWHLLDRVLLVRESTILSFQVF
jgi:hypothetical protein